MRVLPGRSLHSAHTSERGHVMKKLTIILILVLATVVVMSAFAPVATAAKNPNPRVILPTAKVQGSTYGDWGAKWWQWALGIPASINPLADESGDLVAVGQSGNVWFLCGTIYFSPMPGGPDYAYEGVAERTCTIPTGKTLFFPIVNVEASTAEGNGETVEELAALCDFYATHTTSLAVTVDGRPLKNLFSYRGTSGGYLLSWPDDDVLFGLPPLDEPTLSVSDGYWIMLAPLKVGHHTLHWTGRQEFTEAADGFNGIFSQDITYHLTVVPR